LGLSLSHFRRLPASVAWRLFSNGIESAKGENPRIVQVGRNLSNLVILALSITGVPAMIVATSIVRNRA
jgi:hypothetical protein